MNRNYYEKRPEQNHFSEKNKICQQKLPPENGFTTPPQQDFNTDALRGTMQNYLADNIGEYVVIEFLIGTSQMVRKQGVLYSVGTGVVTLYDEEYDNFITCDVFSVKFVYFYRPGQRPGRNYNVLSGGNNVINRYVR